MGLPVPVARESSCDDVQLGREITLLSAQMNIANYRLLKLIAEFDIRGAWRCGGTVRSCAHWLSARCAMTIGAAREKVRVARQLAGLPEVEQAFSSGELSYSKVRAITRVATQQNEGFMVLMAEKSSASHLEKLVARYQPVDVVGSGEIGLGSGAMSAGALGGSAEGICLGEEGDSDAGNLGIPGAERVTASADAMDEEEHREQARELYWFQDKDGMWIIHAKLPPEQGQLVMKALEVFARPLQEERQDDWKETQKARLQAVAREISQRHREAEGGGVEEISAETAQIEQVPEKISAETRRVEPGYGENSAESFSQFMNHVRADAFAAMAEHFLATSGDYPQFQGLKGAERCQVVLHVDVNTLREQRTGVCCTHGKAHFEEKPWLSPRTARRLSCDASLVTVLEDDAGKVLNVGRRSRIVPANIRRALAERDGVCRYPGCHESRYVDAHHVQHWAEGGETSLENLVTLCRFHHRQLHRGCFEVRVEGVSAEISGDDQRLVFSDPAGRRLVAALGEQWGEKQCAGSYGASCSVFINSAEMDFAALRMAGQAARAMANSPE